ncbi:MAG TPA: carboxypeptidase-like regulatory domain-containing protein [Solirubrobacteraceae bacterium]
MTGPASDVRVGHSINDVFAVDRDNYATSTKLRDYGLITFLLLSDWQHWMDRRVESVRFLDPDTVRRQVSVDLTVPRLPKIMVERDGTPVQFLPLGLLRKRRLAQFDLWDESRRVLPLMSSGSNGALAAATLMEGARAFARPRTDLPPKPILDDIWDITNAQADHALETWRRLAQGGHPGDAEGDWRRILTCSWRFMSLANDLARSFLVLTPIHCHADDRRVIKFAYTEPALIARNGKARRSRNGFRRTLPVANASTSRSASEPRRCTLHVKMSTENSNRGLPGLCLTLTHAESSASRTIVTGADGCWTDQVQSGLYHLQVEAPAGLLLTEPDTLSIDIKNDRTLLLTFREVPHRQEPEPAERTWRGRRSEQIGWGPKTVEITAPAAGHARSYHLEYLVAEGMQATFATLSELPSAEPTDDNVAQNDATGFEPRTDRHHATEDRVHLYLSDVPQEYTASATIKLRPRTSTVVRGATFVSALSLAMILVVRWRWQSLGVSNIGTEVALLLAVPGGLSAYVARSHSDRFTSIVLTGLRTLALSTTLWCLLAATIVLVSRSAYVNDHGLTHVGRPLWWTNLALDLVLVCNLAALMLLANAWRRAASPPEAHDTSPSKKPPIANLSSENGRSTS